MDTDDEGRFQSMNFTPAPENDFRHFYETYLSRCRARVPGIRGIAAKWAFEDLIPGLSDFDTRFILHAARSVDDWHAMSLAVGEVHTELAVEVPQWARTLEHLPGLNLTVSEITNPLLYYPEFSQWTFYDGDREALEAIESALGAHRWGRRDEIFHLKKIAVYYGPYIRGIDPEINYGAWASKHPLHSRFMHYFAPPVQSMVSLVERRSVRGKLEALRLARRLLPSWDVIDLVFDSLDRHYEVPELYEEPELTNLERRLERYLTEAWAALADHVTLLHPDPGDTRRAVETKVKQLPYDPIEAFFAGTKFCRLMKGRLLFYSRHIEWFDSIPLIENELGRIVRNFCAAPLEAYARTHWEQTLDMDAALERLRGQLTVEEIAGVRRFARIASAPRVDGEARAQSRAAADTFEPVLSMIEKLSENMMKHAKAQGGTDAPGTPKDMS